jgi:nicotinate phosphoribosyltransferase
MCYGGVNLIFLRFIMAYAIDSLLDTDLYKFTMQQVVLHHFPSALVEYKFKCRNEGVDLARHARRVREEIDHLCSLSFREDELDYLASLRYIKPSYVAFLRGFKLNPDHVSVEPLADGALDIRIRGPWFHAILFEVPILSIVNHVNFESQATPARLAQGRARLDAKIALLEEAPEAFKFSDFGTRRRFSGPWQREVVERLAKAQPQRMAGTSNTLLAKELGLMPIGTMAHEYLQAFQALGSGLRSFQKDAFETWAQEYRGDLGIALSDIVGVDAFLRDFDLYFCKLFDGARHDSGDPFEWGEKIIAHYEKHRVDPRSKSLIFSDGLDFPLALRLHERFAERSKPAFGIGTHLTNDLGLKALNVVIKMVKCNDLPVAKISDSPGKAMCEDAWHLRNLARAFDIPEARVALDLEGLADAPERKAKTSLG